jgi:hypothetical protein
MMADTHAANDLELYIKNKAALHAQHTTINKNLATKKVRSQYDHDLAVKAFGYLVENGAKKYTAESGSRLPWHKMFDVPTRKLAAEGLTKDFEGEFELGNYDYLLPKKYQKEMLGIGGKTKFPSRGHARKKRAPSKVTWNLPEGLGVVWSPVNIAYLAVWPAKARIKDQRVLKLANEEDMHDWLRSTYGEAYGRRGGHVSHSHRKTSLAVHRGLHEPGALRAATDRELRGFYRDEKRDVEKARAEASRRGITLHARHKKSPGQLDREIANVVPSWRGGRR